MDPRQFFLEPENIIQKQYEALRAFYTGELTAQETADKFGYKLSSFYSLSRDFKKKLELEGAQQFFVARSVGRKPMEKTDEIQSLIISLRKKYLSVPDIKAVLDLQGHPVSEKYIYNQIKKDGFDRLPRRAISTREKISSQIKLKAPKSFMLDFSSEAFNVQSGLGILCLIPFIQQYGIDQLIQASKYPETEAIDKFSSIMSFVALKLSNVRRYSEDDLWCMERGLGLFALLNVLPKTGWYTSYSDNVTRKLNKDFLKKLHKIWMQHGFLSDTANLDFTSIPYWGDASHLENNWDGSRNKTLPSILAVLAQEPESGILRYADTCIRHDNKSEVAVEFLDFYTNDCNGEINYLVFDSKFTTYQNLKKMSKRVKFLTIRRRGKNIVDKLNKKPSSAWKKIRVPDASGRGRTLKVFDEKIFLKAYEGELRQIAITGGGKIKPALIITNEFDLECKLLIRKYAQRWLVEKSISEQIEFFHLNRVSSSMIIKVDFDLTMSVLAHNLLRLFAMNLPGFSHYSDYTLYKKFLSMNGSVEISRNQIIIKFKKKRNLPILLEAMEPYQNIPIEIFGGRRMLFKGDTSS